MPSKPSRPGLICIPAFNEAPRLPATLAKLASHLPEGFAVLVVDDGSGDGTPEVARASGADCLSLPIHLGYGGALQTGYKYAFRAGYEILVQMDADGQHEPAGIPRLVEPIRQGRADFVIGNRFHAGCDYPSPIIREIGRQFFALICRALTGFRLNDPTSGFKAMNRRALELLIGDGFPVDFPDADVFIMMHYCGLRITEVDVQMRPSPPKSSMHDGIIHPLRYTAKMLLSVFMTILRQIGGSHA